MTAFLTILLIVVGGLLAWVVKLLLASPPGTSSAGSGKRFIEDAQMKDILEQARERGGPHSEVEAVAEKLLKRIDQKIDLLKDLMKQADQKIDSLRRTDFVLPAEFPRDENGGGRKRGKGEKMGPDDEKRVKIVALRRKGVPPSDIAREVGVGLGEVELILRIEGF